MVEDEIAQHRNAARMKRRNQRIERFKSAHLRLRRAVIHDVIAMIALRGIKRRQPYGPHTQRSDVIRFFCNTHKIAQTICVAVCKAAGKDLIYRSDKGHFFLRKCQRRRAKAQRRKAQRSCCA